MNEDLDLALLAYERAAARLCPRAQGASTHVPTGNFALTALAMEAEVVCETTPLRPRLVHVRSKSGQSHSVDFGNLEIIARPKEFLAKATAMGAQR